MATRAADVLSGNGALWSVEKADAVEWLRALPRASVDLVFGSPPYEDSRTYLENGEDLGIARDTEEWVAWVVEVVKAALHATRGLVAFVVGHGKRARRWSGGPALLCADLIRGGVCLRSPAWYKRNGIMGSGTTDWLRADLEFIVCATNEDAPLPWSDNTAMGHPPKYSEGGALSHRTKSGTRVTGRSRGGKERTAYREEFDRFITVTTADGKLERQAFKNPGKANPGNVIDCGAVGGGHLGSPLAHENEAPFPEELAEFFVRSFASENGIVCDPFSGSGTTGAVALKWGRRFIGCDLRQSQVDLTTRRLKGEATLFDPVPPGDGPADAT